MPDRTLDHSSPLPGAVGVGFKPQHFPDILERPGSVGFFEVHAENYMGAGGPPHAMLERIRGDYALSVHGVGLSIGGRDPIDNAHLARLKAVCDRYQPGLVSEHLAWSSHGQNFYNDLLPLPLTEETLARVVEHVHCVQETLQRTILIENPATYLLFGSSTIPETEFLAELSRRTGCGLLLDINNIYVSATNHGFDPHAYLDAFAHDAVGEFHLGGHHAEEHNGEPLLIDTHGEAIAAEVFALYAKALRTIGGAPTLIERDNDVPAWDELAEEAATANTLLAAANPALAERAA
ncbi:MAG TPA: DUF692 domain-containing protein [Methylovirgula sp.]